MLPVCQSGKAACSLEGNRALEGPSQVLLFSLQDASGKFYRCSHHTAREKPEEQLVLAAPPARPPCEPVQIHVSPVNSKAFLGTLLARYPSPLCWADLSRRGWNSEANQCASEMFVLTHNMLQPRSHNVAAYSWIYKWQNRKKKIVSHRHI